MVFVLGVVFDNEVLSPPHEFRAFPEVLPLLRELSANFDQVLSSPFEFRAFPEVLSLPREHSAIFDQVLS
ncbi:hypothetical protein [Sporosarcina sp. 6E9]|uniref:hypothetical protein n=1 Tax=Sporosarcina sp. 6E9 TaxID=2819235 RepID=UPI001AD251DD|nr:hypothetical protein [Sporosarcina sp. 6E9]MBO1911036.1 hypothetical protein [Microvirga sp. 3-52]